jgi:sugar phosphate isomerase/epimerase
MDTERALAYADRFGLDHVELFAAGEPWREGILSDPEAVRERLDRRGLDLTAHLPFPLDLGSPLPTVREATVAALDRYLEPLSTMGAEKAVLHLDETATSAENYDPSDAVDHLLDSATAASARGADHEIEICVENLPGATFDTDQLRRLFAETEVSATLDTGHAVIDGWSESEIADLVREYPERVSHVHLNDNRVTADAWQGDDEHLPFGAGTVAFETILAPAIEGTWTPTLTMEIVTWDEGYVRTSVRRLHDLLGRTD